MDYADHALMSCVETIQDVADNDEIKEFDSKVGRPTVMGFGLHYGWAIEGAVGSDKKVDATYLSPHVNMSARLEAATKQFDCSILVSEDFYNRMSEDNSEVSEVTGKTVVSKRHMRKVDRVLVVGSTFPYI